MSFYAYIHCKPDGTPFYVGKGNDARVSKKKRNHNRHHLSILNKYGEENVLVGKLECSTEGIAFDLERGLIKRLRKMGIDIVNLTDGGEGASGSVRSPETREKMSAAQRGNKKCLGVSRSIETRAKMAAGKIGNQWNVGREYSAQTKRKKSRSLGGTSVECTKDNITLVFFSIAEAAKSLGLNAANITHHINRQGKRKPHGVKGWVFRRVKE